MKDTSRYHKYQVTLKNINDETKFTDFNAISHDEIFEKLDIIHGKLGISLEEEKALLVGLKLAGEVILQNKDNELFKEMKNPFKEIMVALKSRVK